MEQYEALKKELSTGEHVVRKGHMEVKVNNKKITDTKIPKDWDRDTIVAHCAKLANINNDDLVKSVFVSRKFVNFITRK